MTAPAEQPAILRAFVAIEISTPVRKALESVQRTLRRTQAHVAWVPPKNIHISLAFLGNILQTNVPLIATALDCAADDAVSFSVDVAGLGWFGKSRAPRILWAGIRPCAALLHLQSRTGDTLRDAGIDLESRRYHPHLTLGRVRSARGREALLRAMDTAQAFPPVTFQATQVVLMRSVLEPGGARYVRLHTAVL